MAASNNQSSRKNERRSRLVGLGIAVGLAAFALVPIVAADHVGVATPAGQVAAHHDPATGAAAGASLGASTAMVPAPLPLSAGAAISLDASEEHASAHAQPIVQAAGGSTDASIDTGAGADGSGSAHAKGPTNLFEATINWFVGLF